jgi:hypothetical protein
LKVVIGPSLGVKYASIIQDGKRLWQTIARLTRRNLLRLEQHQAIAVVATAKGEK